MTASGVLPARETRSNRLGEGRRRRCAEGFEDAVDSAFAPGASGGIQAGDAGVGREGNNGAVGGRFEGDAVAIAGEGNDGAAFRRFIAETGIGGGFGKITLGDARHGVKPSGHAVAEGDRACLVQQQRIHVAGGFHRAAAGGDHVEADQPIHAGDADRG